MANLLVTGGAGFIGANFVHYWVKQYPSDTIVVLDALTYAGNRANLNIVAEHPNFSFVHGDICDTTLIEQLMQTHAIDTVVHFAAESHVDRSITGPDAFIETNIIGTYSLLKAARKTWLSDTNNPQPHRFHHVSTDEVYGSLNADDPAFSETTAYAPNSPYSASKAASDHLVRAYHHTYGLNVTTSNCSNNYGPYHYPEKLLPLAITNLLNGKAIPVYGKGDNIRDWLHVEDHANGIDLVIKSGRNGETYNIGGHNELTNLQVLELLCQAVDECFSNAPALSKQYPLCPAANGKPCIDSLTFVTDRPGHDQRYGIDPSKLENELGYQAKHNVYQGIQSTVEWYLNNREWWAPLLP